MTERPDGETASESRFGDRYELGRLIGSGGTAEVYEAVQRALDRRVAIKLLSPAALLDEEWRERFGREARTCASLAHANVMRVFDHGVADGRPYLVTELIEGRPLATLMSDKRQLTAGAIFRIVEQVLDGLEAVHALGIVHRDLKPENILIGAEDDLPVKITDFGVAKRVGPPGAHATAQGIVLGTPAYMAPEQVAGQPPGPGSDLYAVAVMLYEMIVGEHPFQAENTRDMLRAQLLTDPTIPWALHPSIRRLLYRGLEKSPLARFQSAVEFKQELRALEREILGEAGVVSLSSGSISIEGIAPPPSGGVVRPSGQLCVTTISGATPIPDRAGRDTGTSRALEQGHRLVIALGLICAALVTAAIPALLWTWQ